MRAEKLKFIKRSALFLALFSLLTLVLVALPVYTFLAGREYYSLDTILGLQKSQGGTFLYGEAYSDQQSLYKLKFINSQKCDVVALGTSRVMQMRSGFFNASFCNAGGSVYSVSDFKTFLAAVDKENKPRVLIISLDQNFFHDTWTDNRQNFNETGKFSVLVSNLLKIYIDVFQGKIDLKTVESSPPNQIGIAAIMKGEGYRNDGSYEYGKLIAANSSVNDRVIDTILAIRNANNRGRFARNVSISEKSLNDLDSVLDYAHKNNIRVIGYLPSYAKEVLAEMKADKNDYAYLFQMPGRIKPVFDKYGYDFYDFTDLATVSASNCEVIDGFHPSEKANLRILIAMGENSSALNGYIDMAYLKNKLKNSPGCFSTAAN